MKLSVERQGELCILGVMVLSGIFPILISVSFKTVSPFISLSVSSLFAALFFAIVMTLRKKWRELLNQKALKYTLLATIIIGVLFYLLTYLGIRFSSPGTISLLGLSEIFFSFLVFHVWKKEYIPHEHIYGAILILSGAMIVLYPTIGNFNLGNLFILIGCAIVPFGNLFARKARDLISTETLMFVRALTSAVILYLLSFVFGATNSFSTVMHVLPLLLINGIVMIGCTTYLWIEGIHRITVTKANALNSIAPLLTLFFAWILLQTAPNAWQLVAFIPMFAGVLLLGKNPTKSSR